MKKKKKNGSDAVLSLFGAVEFTEGLGEQAMKSKTLLKLDEGIIRECRLLDI